MTAAFVSRVPSKRLSEVEALLRSAPGFISLETFTKKDRHEAGMIFCRLHEGTFKTFKTSLQAKPEWDKSILIEEGARLGEETS